MSLLKNQTCCFTGHRAIPAQERDSIFMALRNAIQNLVLEGYRYFGTGGALGFDTLAAQAVLSLRGDFPYIKLILVLPCKDQASRWKDTDRKVYEEIKNRADKVVYISERYTPDCMFHRNRHLVDCSSTCVCYLTQKCGGTAYTVEYAHKHGLRVINIVNQYPKDILHSKECGAYQNTAIPSIYTQTIL